MWDWLRRLWVTPEPKGSLNIVAFYTVFRQELERYWPDVPMDEANRYLSEFLKDSRVQFGDPRFVWTAAGAKEIARDIVQTCSET